MHPGRNGAAAFFVDNYPVAWTREENSPGMTWTELKGSVLSNHFGNIKRAVRMVLMHADSFDSWGHLLRITRKPTELLSPPRNEYGRFFCFGTKTIERFYKLTSHATMKVLENLLWVAIQLRNPPASSLN
jgi:hypothetical protein